MKPPPKKPEGLTLAEIDREFQKALKVMQQRAVFRCDLCGAEDDSACACPDFWSRPETIQAGKDMRGGKE